MKCGDAPETLTPAPTPAISETLVTSPSMAPNTAGRSQPPDTSLCSWPCASFCSLISTVMVGCLRVFPHAGRALGRHERPLPGSQGSNGCTHTHYSQPRSAYAGAPSGPPRAADQAVYPAGVSLAIARDGWA